MFTFSDFPKLSERNIQKVLRNVDMQVIAKAVCGEDNKAVFVAFASVMSRMAAKSLRQTIAQNGDVPQEEVARCQGLLVNEAQKLADTGDISLP